MLGLIHKCVLGIAPAALKNLFPLKPSTTSPHATRFATSLHPYQLVELNHHTDVSPFYFGLVRIYNRLPSDAVDAKSVKTFQFLLTKILRARCENNGADWERYYSPRRDVTAKL